MSKQYKTGLICAFNLLYEQPSQISDTLWNTQLNSIKKGKILPKIEKNGTFDESKIANTGNNSQSSKF